MSHAATSPRAYRRASHGDLGTRHARPERVDPHELLMTAARAAAVYVMMLIVIRALGKRTVGNFSAFDLLVALMLGELVDEIIYGDVRFLQGTVAIVAIAALAYADAWLSYKHDGMDAMLEGTPTIVIRNGDYDEKGLRQERMNRKDVLGHLRAQGIDDMREVRLAIVENDGSVSILRHAWAQPAQKADVRTEEGEARARAIDDRAQPEKRTDSELTLGS